MDLNINNKETLLKLQEQMNKVFDEKIEILSLKESIDKIDTISFIQCKNVFEGISDKLFETKKGKKIIGKYIKLLSENEELRTLNTLYEKIVNKDDCEQSYYFINECINEIGKFTTEALNNKISLLKNVLKECVYQSNIKHEELDSLMEYKNDMDKNLSFIMENKRSLKNIDDYTKSIYQVCESISNNKRNDDIIVNVTNVSDYHEFMTNENVSETDKEFMNDCIKASLNEDEMKNTFVKYKNVCIEKLSNKISLCETKEDEIRFTTMKSNLEKKEFIKEHFDEDLINLYELKTVLN